MAQRTDDFDLISTLTATNSEIDISDDNRAETDSVALPPHNISTNINSLALQSSSGVHFGNRVVYNGPVSIERDKSEDEKFSLSYLRRHKATAISTLCSCVLFALLILVLAIKFDNSAVESTVSYPYQLRIVKRSEWKAENPLALPELLSTPVDAIIVDCVEGLECYTEVGGDLFNAFFCF
jgi:hypothetical protein